MTRQLSTAEPDPHPELDRIWANPRGWRALTIVNHSVIGIRFLLTGAAFFLVGGLLALLMRTQLALPNHDFVDHEVYNQLFTMHGTVMMFLFAVPMMEGLAIYLIPKMIGARDLVFPRLSALGYWCYLFGGLIVLGSLAFAVAPASGWFMYTPLSSSAYSPGPGADVWLLGITFVEISAVSAGIELVVAILRTRTAGMRLDTMPLFAWYILATALMIVFGFPPLIAGSILLELERAAGMPFFDVSRGGDPILWQHLFWLFGHPEVYIIFLPAAGVVSTLLPVFAGRPIVGYRWVVLAVISTAFISFGLWVHHMFAVGIPHLAQAFFSAASMMVAVPTGIQVFAWLATLWGGQPRRTLPMLWLTGFLFIFVAGGLTGVMVALVPFDWQVHDTHFVVAHLHYVLIGGMVFPLIAGLYYWLPLFSGRLPSLRMGRWAFWLVFVGFNGTFFIMHWTGLLGMPRRVYTYDAGLGWALPNMISSVSGFVMAIGIAMLIGDLALHFRFGRRAPANPWQAGDLEWSMSMPPPPYNFARLPAAPERYPLWQPERGETAASAALAETDHRLRETLGSSAVDGAPREIVVLPGNSWWPLATAIALAFLCLSLLTKHYALAAAASVVVCGLAARWSWENGAHPSTAPLSLQRSGDLPWHSRTFDGPGRWGMIVTVLASASLFGSLLFGWVYYWTVAPDWQAPASLPLPWWQLTMAGLPLTLASCQHRRLHATLRAGSADKLAGRSGSSAALGLLHVIAVIATLASVELHPTHHAAPAIFLVLLLFCLVHSSMATLGAILQWRRIRRGYVQLLAPFEVAVLAPLWYYSTAIFWITAAALLLLPLAW